MDWKEGPLGCIAEYIRILGKKVNTIRLENTWIRRTEKRFVYSVLGLMTGVQGRKHGVLRLPR